MCVIFADANVIDLQLERAVGFVPQSKPNGVYLQIQKDAADIDLTGHRVQLQVKRYSVFQLLLCLSMCVTFTLPCRAREDADRLVSSHDVKGRTWRKVSVNEQHLSIRMTAHFAY